VLPTAAAYEGSAAVIEHAVSSFASLGIVATTCLAMSRTQTMDEAFAAQIREADLVYLTDGSAMHLRSALKDSLVWNALIHAWKNGAAIVAAPGSAMALGDPMLDPRGGAFGLGLGIVSGLAILPAANLWQAERRNRTMKMGTGNTLALIDDTAALIRLNTGAWSTVGDGEVTIVHHGNEIALSELETLTK
jgi:cyanophycinase